MSIVVNKMSIRLAIAFALLFIGMTAVAGNNRVSAQGDAPSHPAHIHTGTCAAPGEVVAPLNNVSSSFLVDGTATAGSESVGSAAAVQVEMSTTTVSLALTDILGSDHLIMVHESDENIQNYIACGDIGGVMMGQSDLPVGLTAVNDSGYAGVANLHDEGDGSTTVTVSLVQTGAGGQTETAASAAADDTSSGSDTAASEAEGPTTHSITIKNFAYDPSELEIKVGDTVTWTNEDSVPHTATQRPSGSGFQSGTLSPGDSFSYTFDSAGEFEYFCEFHASMAGKIVVTE